METATHDYSYYYTIDFGCNFASEKAYPEEKLDCIMTDSWNDGVDKIVCISNSKKEAIRIVSVLSDRYENMHFTIGVHPHNAKQFTVKDLDFFELHVNNPKCFAIGEIGLDFNRNFSTKEEQMFAFRSQIDFAKKHNKKMYLHCRDAFEDFVLVLKEKQFFSGLIHCFTGSLEEATEFTSMGFKLGITGWLLDERRNKQLKRAVIHLPLSCFVVETDAPFMPCRNGANKRSSSVPQDTALIVEEIARLKKIDPIVCGKQIYAQSKEYLTGENVI